MSTGMTVNNISKERHIREMTILSSTVDQ